MRTLCRLIVASMVLTAALAPSTVAAAPTEEAREEARELAKRGYLQFQEANYASAIALFERAQALVSAPTHLIFIARAQVASGRLVEGVATYEAIVAMALKADDPEAFRRALVDADAELAELRPRVPSLRVEVEGASPAEVTVEVDGEVVEGDATTPLDPGDHELRATVTWAAPQTKTVTLAEGQREVVSLEIPPPVAGGGDEHAYLLPAAITLGLGGALLVAGAVTGGVSLSQVADIETRCVNDRCPPEDEARADEARALGHASTALFVVGGVAAAAGTTLLVLGWPEGPEASARLSVTPGGLRLQGRF